MSYIGNVFQKPMLELASKAANKIMEFRTPRALTLDCTGGIYIGMVESADEAELVGVYRYTGLIDLRENIVADLANEIQTRKLQPAPYTRVISARRGETA